MSSLSPIPAPFEIARPRRGAALAPVPLATGLLRAGTHRVKRFCDVLLVALLAPPGAFLGFLIALAIRLDSPGPVFFRHTRAGKARLPFGLWKFRTMVEDAGARLEEHLRRNPECDREWVLTHKLRNDPRVTRVGRFLRKTSLDELPQFWNVLKGDMSMVGPRPIVFEEIPKYGSGFALYAQVLPGVTGLWQVSGRNDTHYSRRVELDCHYVRAWNAALDFGILLRTVAVMIRGRGAY